MTRIVAFPLVALLLICSISAPCLFPLPNKDCGTALLADTDEEEKKGEKDSEKNFDDKELFLNNFNLSNSYIAQNRVTGHGKYVLHNSDFVSEILLPPPRRSA